MSVDPRTDPAAAEAMRRAAEAARAAAAARAEAAKLKGGAS